MDFEIDYSSFSRYDLKRNVIIPNVVSLELAEFVGVLLGDGYLHLGKSKYTVGIVGNPKKEIQYYNHLYLLVKKLFNINSRILLRARSIVLIFKSKAVFLFLIRQLRIAYNMGKCQTICIPNIFLTNNLMALRVIRGLFDTDGTIFTSKKPGVESYPSIEFCTTSLGIAKQVRDILVINGFKVSNLRQTKSKKSNLVNHRLSLFGIKNVKLWKHLIDFSNGYKREKMFEILKMGSAGFEPAIP